MQNIMSVRESLEQGSLDQRIKEIYVDEQRVPYNRERYIRAIDRFTELFPSEKEIEIYSAPGRSEVCGNHTDHQNGMVLATSINLDAIAIVAKAEEPVIRLVSGDFPMEEVDVADLSMKEEEQSTTTALIRGVAAGMKERGHKVGGFTAYITSDVLMGAGMSSSAAFESLIGTILSGLYNDMKVSSIEIAQIGQYAENIYFGKPCGLMDQMACSVGGMIFIDFKEKEHPEVRQVHTDFEKAGLSLCIVDTKGSHADLTPDYAAVPAEMNQVAQALGREHLREVPRETFFKELPKLWKETSGRAVLRAIHFYEEEERVLRGVKSLEESDYPGFLSVIKASGDSSAKYLQNIYSPKDVDSQNVTVALAVSESILGENGVCRVHGGGFAGTIQAFVKNEAVAAYKEQIEAIYGDDSCHVLKVRLQGGIRVL
ncbi:galactokinase family protein [Jutongia sp.]|uniref:galactokinase n=1 Tax=Jutongia sp. TaxID=2944204 RepID=UPI00033828E0|nr:galactokinase [Clostridium sp.]OKZ82663.1 MAG: galactokinase [Clostridium sp. 44_14]CDE68213.1 galactokinase [Clostridium sp. CAG:277]